MSLPFEGTGDIDGDGVPNWRDPNTAQADIEVTKTGPATVTPGETTTWTVTVTNHGPDPAVGVLAIDQLPAGATIDELGSSPRCSYNPDTGRVVCTRAGLAAGETKTASVSLRIPDDATAGDNVVNHAALLSNTDDPDANNNAASASATVVAPAPSPTTVQPTPTSTVTPSEPLVRTG